MENNLSEILIRNIDHPTNKERFDEADAQQQNLTAEYPEKKPDFFIILQAIKKKIPIHERLLISHYNPKNQYLHLRLLTLVEYILHLFYLQECINKEVLHRILMHQVLDDKKLGLHKRILPNLAHISIKKPCLVKP